MQVPAENIITNVIIITCILLIAGLFLFFYVNLYNQRKKKFEQERSILEDDFRRQLIRSQLDVQEHTRTHLAQELHDNVGQTLGSVRMLIGVTNRQLGEIPDTLHQADDRLEQALNDLRALSRSLNPAWLANFSLIENLIAETQRLQTGQLAVFSLDLCRELDELHRERQLLLFRIIQEAIQNSLKHGKSSQISIRAVDAANHIVIEIRDNGSGFDPEQVTLTGVGLLHLQQRARLLEGNIDWQSTPGSGTTVTVRIPVQTTLSIQKN